MPVILVLLLTVIAVVISFRLRVPGGVNAGQLGWMSAQWLADHRKSQHPS